ncbi:hypothetical protein FHL15_009959 [Xylaria flabelliformis]|uniref:Uncharacterized protein n=1 Tax=Xylaria flabelliformis TaxID=2512241 RepID=A0A553HMK8_9PEZI|nr:hypothetical protein FHL15_009959 [Xylaria flabelliformis]
MGEQSHVDSPKAGTSKHSTASSAWTPEMRDRQARGKNPYNADSDDSDWGPGGQGSGSSSAADVGPQRVGAPKPKDRFAIYERRRIASQILNSTELLMMAAVRDDESIPATRLKYMRVLCGLEGSGDGTPRAGAAAAAARLSTADKQRKRINLDQGYRSVSGNTREK